ncbi:hypothetical protein L0337_43435 [candidate division KSB1 bacterium]|nr:hypothetical protein [candidate division KSB1 bacterium]
MLLLSFVVLLLQIEAQKIIIVAVLIGLGLLTLFFFYSIAVLLLYWLVWLLLLAALGVGIYVRTQDIFAGNVTIGIALIWAVIWYVLAFSKKPNWLRRILDSLNRSLP